jgi:hypothetical protein
MFVFKKEAPSYVTLIKSLATKKMLILNAAADATSKLIPQATNKQADPDSNA